MTDDGQKTLMTIENSLTLTRTERERKKECIYINNPRLHTHELKGVFNDNSSESSQKNNFSTRTTCCIDIVLYSDHSPIARFSPSDGVTFILLFINIYIKALSTLPTLL